MYVCMVENSGTPNSHTLSLPLVSPPQKLSDYIPKLNQQRSFFEPYNNGARFPKGAPGKPGFQNFASPPFPLCVIYITTDTKSTQNRAVKIYTSR